MAYLSGHRAAGTGQYGDYQRFASYGKLSDAAINLLDFSIIKFDPTRFGTHYFKFDGLTWGNIPRRVLPYTTSHQAALSGQWIIDSCRQYTVCNFGRGYGLYETTKPS